MKLEYIKDTNHPMYEKALELYKISFPYHEQREKISQDYILNYSEYKFGLIYDEDVFVGLVLYWETKTYIYIEHLCILPEIRNKNYGQKTLYLLKEKGKILILEIDIPVDDISKRRKGFYERCEFVENSYHHIHPPYHRENNGHELAIMTYPNKISNQEYDEFRKYLNNKVMDKAFV